MDELSTKNREWANSPMTSTPEFLALPHYKWIWVGIQARLYWCLCCTEVSKYETHTIKFNSPYLTTPAVIYGQLWNLHPNLRLLPGVIVSIFIELVVLELISMRGEDVICRDLLAKLFWKYEEVCKKRKAKKSVSHVHAFSPSCFLLCFHHALLMPFANTNKHTICIYITLHTLISNSEISYTRPFENHLSWKATVYEYF